MSGHNKSYMLIDYNDFNAKLARLSENISRKLAADSNKINYLHCRRKEERQNEWDFVPSSEIYIKNLHQILAKEEVRRNEKIIDLGCGVSPVLIYLYYIGFYYLYGVDNELKYLNQLEHLLSGVNTKKFNLKRMSYSFKHYLKQFKVVYLYMPFSNQQMWNNLLKRVFDAMSSGSILISFYAMYSFKPNIPEYYIRYIGQDEECENTYAYFIKP